MNPFYLNRKKKMLDFFQFYMRKNYAYSFKYKTRKHAPRKSLQQEKRSGYDFYSKEKDADMPS